MARVVGAAVDVGDATVNVGVNDVSASIALVVGVDMFCLYLGGEDEGLP